LERGCARIQSGCKLEIAATWVARSKNASIWSMDDIPSANLRIQVVITLGKAMAYHPSIDYADFTNSEWILDD
jgi:hypothetical protein